MSRAVNIAVEDNLSEDVLKKLLSQAKHRIIVRTRYPVTVAWEPKSGPSGYGAIKKNLPAYNIAASAVPFVVLVDADDRPCHESTIADWLGPTPRHKDLLVRVAVREVEAWLLADREAIAEYLAVKPSCIPPNPERLKDPKRYIARLAARSTRKEIREAMARPLGTRSKTGPYFQAALRAFVKQFWDGKRAAHRSPSLERAIAAFDRL